jgi:hypothetical protein
VVVPIFADPVVKFSMFPVWSGLIAERLVGPPELGPPGCWLPPTLCVAVTAVTILMAVMVAVGVAEGAALAWPTTAPIPRVAKTEATTVMTR